VTCSIRRWPASREVSGPPFFNLHKYSREIGLHIALPFLILPSFLQFLRSFICTSSSLSSLPVFSRLSDETRSTDENADRIRPAAQPQNENHNRCSAYSTSPAFLRFRSYSCPYRPPSDVPTIFSLRIENQGEGPRWRGESHHINMASSITRASSFLPALALPSSLGLDVLRRRRLGRSIPPERVATRYSAGRHGKAGPASGDGERVVGVTGCGGVEASGDRR
jgi:hypothetical protein